MARRKYPFHMVAIVAGLAGFYFWRQKKKAAAATALAIQSQTIGQSITGTNSSVASH